MRAAHRIGSCTVTSLVPSGKVASTWTSWIISAMPSITWSRGEDVRAGLHQLGDGAAVARALDDEVGDQRDRLGMVELDAALEPPARHHRGHGDQQLVLLARRQVHAASLSISQQPRQRRRRAAPPARATRSRRSARAVAGDRIAPTSMPFQAADADLAGIPADARAHRVEPSPRRRARRSTRRDRRARRRRPPAPASCSAIAPSSRSASAKTSRPPRRTRQRSRKRAVPHRLAHRGAAEHHGLDQEQAAHRRRSSTSMRARQRARRSNRMVSCGSQSSLAPAPTVERARRCRASAPSER